MNTSTQTDIKNKHFDLVIIGGGINGCAIAADAAIKGLSVCLLEKNSLASGTSAASSNLIHGGLRYLENYDFKLVRDALKEQTVWQQRAPHLVKPLQFILPYEKHLRPKWMIRFGLWIYDHLYLKKVLPKTTTVSRSNSDFFNNLDTSLSDGFSYYDCETQGAAITVAFAKLAQHHGAVIKTHTPFNHACIHHHHWLINYGDPQNGDTITAAALINAAGPWVTETNEHISPNQDNIHVQTIKGSHIVVPKLYDGDHAYILQNKDGRIVFTLPYTKNMTAIGTTDIIYNNDLDNINIAEDEQQYLCDLVNHYFQKPVSTKDIINSWSGVRALATNQTKDAKSMSREHQLIFNNFNGALLLTLLGGKLTTARSVGEEALAMLRPYFKHMNNQSTKDVPLAGYQQCLEQLVSYKKDLIKQFPFIKQAIIDRWLNQFGDQTCLLLKGVTSIDDLGEHFGHGLYAKEVDFLRRYYFCETVNDIIFSLTRFYVLLSVDEQQQLSTYIKNHPLKAIL